MAVESFWDNIRSTCYPPRQDLPSSDDYQMQLPTPSLPLLVSLSSVNPPPHMCAPPGCEGLRRVETKTEREGTFDI